MKLITDIGILLLLGIIVFQDFKWRKISAILIPLLLIAFVARALYRLELIDFLGSVWINFLFVASQLILVTMFYSLKNRKPVNIIDSYLGLGDVLFFLIMCVALTPVNFILFYLTSMIITAIGFLLLNKKKSFGIPLAGAMAGMLFILITCNMLFSKMNLYNDDFISGLLLYS